jgi:hypothetical protein
MNNRMLHLWQAFFNERLHIVLSSLALLWCWDQILSMGVGPLTILSCPWRWPASASGTA